MAFQSSEVKNSYAMELEGLMQSLEFLEDRGVITSSITTDWHSSVRKYLHQTRPHMVHWFDVWHVAKGELFLSHIMEFKSIHKNIPQQHCVTSLRTKT